MLLHNIYFIFFFNLNKLKRDMAWDCSDAAAESRAGLTKNEIWAVITLVAASVNQKSDQSKALEVKLHHNLWAVC